MPRPSQERIFKELRKHDVPVSVFVLFFTLHKKAWLDFNAFKKKLHFMQNKGWLERSLGGRETCWKAKKWFI